MAISLFDKVYVNVQEYRLCFIIIGDAKQAESREKQGKSGKFRSIEGH